MDRESECARDPSRENRAVAVDEAQSGPHRRAARPHDLSDQFRFLFNAIAQFRRWIEAQIKALRIEWRRFRQVLIDIVFRHAAVWRNTKIRCEQSDKRYAGRHPVANQLAISQEMLGEHPNRSER